MMLSENDISATTITIRKSPDYCHIATQATPSLYICNLFSLRPILMGFCTDNPHPNFNFQPEKAQVTLTLLFMKVNR